jgi:hypothetical protein
MSYFAIDPDLSLLLKPSRVPRFATKQDVSAPNIALNHNLFKFD